MTTADAERFGREVARRRRELGLKPKEVHDAGGPGPATLGKIEAGTAGNLHLSTFKKLDLALRLRPGSAASAYDGGTALSPLPANGTGSDQTRVPAPVYVAFPPGVIDEICGIAQDLEQRAAADDKLSEISAGVDRVTDRILRAWTISEIERMRAAGTLEHSMVEMLLGHALRRTPHAPTPVDHEELMYMRWLLDRLPEECPEEMERRLAARWAVVRQMLTNRSVPE